MKWTKSSIFFIWIAIIAMVLGCSRRGVPVNLPIETPAAFSVAGTQKMSERWWTVFGDHRLDSVMDTMLYSNFDLETAWYRLEASKAVVSSRKSFLFPDLEAALRGEQRGSRSGVETSSLELTLGASYEIDLWGRLRSAVDAARFRADASLADYQALAVSLSAETVLNWFRLTEAYNQLKLLNDQIDINSKSLQLMKVRFGSGQVRGVDILRQQQLIESTYAQRISVESDIEVLRHQQAVLTGRIPGQKADSSFQELPDLPPLPETGIPMDLVKRRPDIRNAYNLLLAADRDLATALSSRYPRLSLNATLASPVSGADNLFNDWIYSIAGNLLAPVFYGGRLKAEADRTSAVKQQLVFAYGQAMLTAFREVEDALVLEAKQLDIIASIDKQATLAQQAFEQLRIEYFNGMGNYLDVLTAQSQEQQLRRNLLTARMLLLEYRIALYRALAGSFEIKTADEDA
jgi:NodT family efflux transporter outer membrane factor (OMF) lipoprotein